jgi:hypothetical protein
LYFRIAKPSLLMRISLPPEYNQAAAPDAIRSRQSIHTSPSATAPLTRLIRRNAPPQTAHSANPYGARGLALRTGDNFNGSLILAPHREHTNSSLSLSLFPVPIQ